MTYKELTPWAKRLYTLDKKTLGYGDTAEQPHAEMLQHFADAAAHLQKHTSKRRKSYILVPRNCFKTSDYTIGGMIALIKDNPNLAILLGTHTHDYTKQILGEVKWHLERNETLREEMGDVKTNAPKWAEDAITLATRTINLKEPTIDTCALDKPKVGGHYDVIIIDDLHTRENITPKLLLKARNFLNDLQPLLKPGGILLMVGTRWHHNDIFGHIIAQEEERAKKGKPAEWVGLSRGCYDGPDGLYFPTVLTAEFLEQMREDLTDKDFACQYLNQPIESSASVFPYHILQFYEGDYFARPHEAAFVRVRNTT